MKVHTIKKARKDHMSKDGKEVLIPEGSTYYWWQFRNCKKTKSLTYPTADQLDKYGSVGKDWAELQGRVQDSIDTGEFDSELKEELTTFVDQEDEKVNNIPDTLEYSMQSDEMRERLEEAQELADSYDEEGLENEEE